MNNSRYFSSTPPVVLNLIIINALMLLATELLPVGNGGFDNVASVVDEMLEDGMKVIAVAHKSLGAQDTIALADERDLILTNLPRDLSRHSKSCRCGLKF